MKNHRYLIPVLAFLAGALVACTNFSSANPRSAKYQAVARAVENTKKAFAPDSHLAIFNVGIVSPKGILTLAGQVNDPQAKAALLDAVAKTGVTVQDQITTLPPAQFGDKVWGIGCLSVANGRELPEQKAEMGTQLLMGDIVRVWDISTNYWLEWYLVQSADGYLAWVERDTIVRCSASEVQAWTNAPRLIVTAFEDRILEQPHPDAQPVSDVVMGDTVKLQREAGDWFAVELPDGRFGFLPKTAATDLRAWQASRQPTPQNIERTARSFLGRPYLWGGRSTKGLDCSGFTKLVFQMNGLDLSRNASHQGNQGTAVSLESDLAHLRKGDLLFFGRRGTNNQPDRISHVGIYLGDKLFIHSSGRVRLNSLDPDSPIRDLHRIRGLLRARRILPD